MFSKALRWGSGDACLFTPAFAEVRARENEMDNPIIFAVRGHTTGFIAEAVEAQLNYCTSTNEGFPLSLYGGKWELH